jgi:membrane protein YqaA with SNARE-associated domain
MIPLIAAALWGFAEATFFFLVPDVILSAIAIYDWRVALLACLAGVAGAVAGGALMYRQGRSRYARLQAFLLRLPGISPSMLERVRAEVALRRFLAVLTGPLSGTPYKTYAVEAGRQGLPFAGFLLITIPARLIRFVLVTALAAWLAHSVFPVLPVTWKLAVWAGAWTAFYAWYFASMRRQARC